jgi:hemerythrin-like metal-binding protein
VATTLLQSDQDYIFILLDELNLNLHRGREIDLQTRHHVVETLIGYCSVHLQAEEAQMRTLEYPLLADHEAEHDRLQYEFNSTVKRILNGKDTELVDFLRNSIIRHIVTWDEEFLKWSAQIPQP